MKRVRKQCILLSIQFFLAEYATFIFYYLNVLIFKRSFRKYTCGILYSADFDIFVLNLGTIYNRSYRENNWWFQTSSQSIIKAPTRWKKSSAASSCRSQFPKTDNQQSSRTPATIHTSNIDVSLIDATNP